MPTPRVVVGAAPGEIPSSHLEVGALTTAGQADSVVIKQNLPFICFYNSSLGTTFTLKGIPRGSSDVAQNITIQLAPQSWVTLPTSVFAQVTGTNVGASSAVFWFYSDVALNPSSAGGSGPAEPVSLGEILNQWTPSSTLAFLMAGVGSVAKITPTGSGDVQVTFSGWAHFASGDTIVLKLAYGTGGAPAQNAAASGTIASFLRSMNLALTAGDLAWTLNVVILGLTVGTAYWFDLQADISGIDNVSIVSGGIVELAS